MSGKVICYNCGAPMIWGSDADFEDLGMEGEGIVSFFSCNECPCFAEYCVPFEKDDEED